jgi:hypothetical protein
MSLNKIIIALFFSLPIMAEAQDTEKKQLNKVFSVIQKKMQAGANNNRENVPSEFFFLTLQTDSLGHISAIHLYADLTTKDSSFFALSKLTIEDFTECRMTSLLNTVIIIPVFSSAPADEEDYVNDVFAELFWPFLKNKETITKRGKKTIVTKTLVFSVPVVNRD